MDNNIPSTSPAPNSGTPFNGGAPLTTDQISKMRTQAGIDTNPATAPTQISPQDQLAALRAGTFAPTGAKPTNTSDTSEGIISKGASDVTSAIKNAPILAQKAGGGLGANVLADLGAAGHIVGAVAGTAVGIAGKVLSPLIPQALKDSMSQGIEGLYKDMNNAGVPPEVQKGVWDIVNTIALLEGNEADQSVGEAIPNVGEAASKVAGDVATAPGKSIRAITTKVPEQIKNVTRNASDPDAMIAHLKDMQNLAKESQKGEGGQTPIQKTANDLFGQEGSVTGAIDEGRKAAGEKMGKALATPGVGDAPVDLSENTRSYQDFLGKTNLEKRLGSMSKSDYNTYADFRNALFEFKKPQPLTKVDNFLREWQTRNAQDPTLNKAITNTVHDINETAKSTADKAEEATGQEGHPYRESNDEYRKYIQPHQFLQEERGVQNNATGEFPGSQKLLRQVTSVEGPEKTSFDAVRKLVGNKVGKSGMTMNDQAHLATFVHDIYTGVKPEVALQKLSIGWSFPMSLVRSAKNIIGASGNPDMVIKRMVDLIDKNR